MTIEEMRNQVGEMYWRRMRLKLLVGLNDLSDEAGLISDVYRDAHIPLTVNRLSNPQVMDLYLSPLLVYVPVKLDRRGVITNPEILCSGDLLFFGDRSCRNLTVKMAVDMDAFRGTAREICVIQDGGPVALGEYCHANYEKRAGLTMVRRRLTGIDEPNHLGDRDIGFGASGNDVRELQTQLVTRGYTCGPEGIDGDFGENTALGLKQYQMENNLEVSGVCTRELGRKLNSGRQEQPGQVWDQYQISGDNVTLRSGPGTKYEVLMIRNMGDGIAVPCHSAWVPVDFAGRVFWMERTQVKRDGSFDQVMTPIAFLRSGPGRQFKIVFTASRGMRFTHVSGKTIKRWVPVLCDEIISWMDGRFIAGIEDGYDDMNNDYLLVMTREIPLYTGPGAQYPVYCGAHIGDELIRTQIYDWMPVEDPLGKDVLLWVRDEDVRYSDDGMTLTVRRGTALYREPSPDSELRTWVSKGDKLCNVWDSSEWIPLRVDDRLCFARKKDLEKGNAAMMADSWAYDTQDNPWLHEQVQDEP